MYPKLHYYPLMPREILGTNTMSVFFNKCFELYKYVVVVVEMIN